MHLSQMCSCAVYNLHLSKNGLHEFAHIDSVQCFKLISHTYYLVIFSYHLQCFNLNSNFALFFKVQDSDDLDHN